MLLCCFTIFRSLFQGIICSLAIISTGLAFLYPAINAFALMGLGVPAVCLMLTELSRWGNNWHMQVSLCNKLYKEFLSAGAISIKMWLLNLFQMQELSSAQAGKSMRRHLVFSCRMLDKRQNVLRNLVCVELSVLACVLARTHIHFVVYRLRPLCVLWCSESGTSLKFWNRRYVLVIKQDF